MCKPENLQEGDLVISRSVYRALKAENENLRNTSAARRGQLDRMTEQHNKLANLVRAIRCYVTNANSPEMAVQLITEALQRQDINS